MVVKVERVGWKGGVWDGGVGIGGGVVGGRWMSGMECRGRGDGMVAVAKAHNITLSTTKYCTASTLNTLCPSTFHPQPHPTHFTPFPLYLHTPYSNYLHPTHSPMPLPPVTSWLLRFVTQIVSFYQGSQL